MLSADRLFCVLAMDIETLFSSLWTYNSQIVRQVTVAVDTENLETFQLICDQ